MIEQIPGTTMAIVFDAVGSFQIPLSSTQRIELLTVKLNEAIRHISNLEEKLLSSEDL